MYNENLKNRVFRKLDAALKIYEKLIYTKVGALENAMALRTEAHLREAPREGLSPIAPGERWGGEWQNLWIVGDFTPPAALDGQDLYAVSNCGGVEQLFFLNGAPKGIINSKNRDFIGGSHACQYLGKAAAGQALSLAFECYAGHYDPNTDPYDDYFCPDPTQGFDYTYGGVDICTRNDDVFTLIFDLRELLGAVRRLPGNSFVSAKAGNLLMEINRVLPLMPKDASDAAVMEGVRKALEISRPFFSGGNSRVFGRVGIIGHSHMDTAWLWPVSETVRKCARTYANALRLMDQYPTYCFIQSSALHAEWMKTYYPAIFDEMKRRVAEGRYEPNGGVYVECDCNITSGELMARQFLKGQQFTRENFGYTSDSFWLPDTFGYNANIPQIMKLSNVKYFFTTKIGWNELNRFPFESFVWKGVDGSEVLTHFNRAHCWPDVGDCSAATRDLQMKDASDLRFLAYGFGDGGGGPTPGMIEASLRSSKMEGLPEIVPMTASRFMHELEEQRASLPVYHDELYLELHRGTLTQMHEVKRKNRKAEYALRDYEYFRVLNGLPFSEEADENLKTLLKNQFHDILPGTSIKPVYDVYHREMDGVLAFFRGGALDGAKALVKGNAGVTLFNTLSFDRNDVLDLDVPGYARDYPSQRYVDLRGNERLAVGGLKLEGFGSACLALSDRPLDAESPFSYDGTVLLTPFARLVFDENGYISSFTDLASGRELRKKDGAPLGVLLFGEDVPLRYDNWDVDADVVEKLAPVVGFRGRTLVTDGAAQIRLRSVFALENGASVTQDLVCYASSPRVDFRMLVDWKCPHRLLKIGFDLDVSATRARSEIQFGSIERPTTKNNSLEITKFEVCNRNYTDVSEPGFGVALLNDCKYGVSVSDCNLRLSLHRGGTHPDFTGDAGLHEMTCALLPHAGAFCAEAVVHPAYELNVPAVAVPGEAKITPIVKIDAPNVVAEAVKPAEDGSDDFVLRLYECEGTKTASALCFGGRVSRVCETNLLEDELGEVPVTGNACALTFGPFEIKTLKCRR